MMIEYREIFFEPQALLELSALAVTILYVGKLALEDFWASAGPGVEKPEARQSSRRSAAGSFKSSAGAGTIYPGKLATSRRVLFRSLDQSYNLDFVPGFSALTGVGSLISAPKRSLLNQI